MYKKLAALGLLAAGGYYYYTTLPETKKKTTPTANQGSQQSTQTQFGQGNKSNTERN